MYAWDSERSFLGVQRRKTSRDNRSSALINSKLQHPASPPPGKPWSIGLFKSLQEQTEAPNSAKQPWNWQLAMFLRSCGRADIRLCLFTLPCAIGASCLVIKLVIQCPMWFRHCVHSSFRLSVSSVLSYGSCLLRQFYWWHGSGLLKILSWAHT